MQDWSTVNNYIATFSILSKLICNAPSTFTHSFFSLADKANLLMVFGRWTDHILNIYQQRSKNHLIRSLNRLANVCVEKRQEGREEENNNQNENNITHYSRI